jgi:hypothetical protein
MSISSESVPLSVVDSSNTQADSSRTLLDTFQCYSPTKKENWESLAFKSVEDVDNFMVTMH